MREEYYKARYWGLKAAGLCVSCGKMPEAEGLLCDACRERARLNSQRADKNRYARLRAAGLCTGCKRPVEDGKARCPECARKNTDSVMRRRRERLAQGLCATCGEPTRQGMTTCFKCALKRSARRYAKAVTENE
jgi:predicted amidophosphoribosyltransferase